MTALTASGMASPQPVPRGRASGGHRGPQRDLVWYLGDPHFGHTRIIDLCDRPFRKAGEPDVEEMNQVIIENINATVRVRDHLVITGDVIMGKFDETVKLLKQIRARRVTIIPGNHDRFSLAFQHSGAPEVKASKRRLWKAQYEAVRAGVVCVPDRRPSCWPARLVDKHGSRIDVLVSHYPYRGDSQIEIVTGEDGVEERVYKDRHHHLRPVDKGLPLIHGHVHNSWKIDGHMYNVGVDVNGFMPVSADTLIDWAVQLPMGGRTRTAVGTDDSEAVG